MTKKILRIEWEVVDVRQHLGIAQLAEYGIVVKFFTDSESSCGHRFKSGSPDLEIRFLSSVVVATSC